MTRKIAVALVALALSGCVSDAELQAQDQAACSSYGFQPGTVPYSTCLQNEALARQYYWATADAYPYGWGYPYPWGWGYPVGVGFVGGGFVGGGWHGGHHWGGGWHGGGWHGGHFAGGMHGGGFHGGGGHH